MGPALVLGGAPLGVLKVEGLGENRGGSPDERKGDDPESDDQELTVTAEGRAELRRLLSANVRPQVSDLNKLVIALKIRFLHLMEPVDQRVQAELLRSEEHTSELQSLMRISSAVFCLKTKHKTF